MTARVAEEGGPAFTMAGAPVVWCRVESDSAPGERARWRCNAGVVKKRRGARGGIAKAGECRQVTVARHRCTCSTTLAMIAGAAAKATISSQSRTPSGTSCSTVAIGGK